MLVVCDLFAPNGGPHSDAGRTWSWNIAQVSSVVCVVMVQCSILTNVVGCEKPNLAQCCEMKFTTWVGGPWDI